jgi:hypothetical protein
MSAASVADNLNMTDGELVVSGVRGAVFGKDGRWLIGINDKKSANAFEWPSGWQLRIYERLDGAGALESAALASPDGKYFACDPWEKPAIGRRQPVNCSCTSTMPMPCINGQFRREGGR